MPKLVTLNKDDVILFQGDSITDCQRDRRSALPNDSRALGSGYASLLSAELLAAHPTLNLKTYNRGVSADKVRNLADRWQEDCLILKPAVISILVGVNDFGDLQPDKYFETLTQLLARTRSALPDSTLILCQPFVLRCGMVRANWFPAFSELIGAAKKAAIEHDGIWVPFQDKFDAAVADGVKPEYWAVDGIHPTLAGHGLLAKSWLEAAGL